MAKELILNNPLQITVVTREEVILTVDKISVDYITDNGTQIIARVSFFNSSGYSKELVLWEGEEYRSIGNWSDNDINNKIIEIVNK